MSENELSKMKVADLKRELKLRGLSITGNKTELQDRLQAALLRDAPLDESAATGDELLDDGVLSDEEEEEVEEGQAKALHRDDDLLKSPSPPTPEGTEKPITDDEMLTAATTTTVVNKKICLKRPSAGSLKTEETEKSKENTEPKILAPKVMKMSERNPIVVGDLDSKKTDLESKTLPAAVHKKISELTLEERLALRAKKFGIINAEVKSASVKNKSEPIDTSSLSKLPDEKQIEILKKRAERFGCVTSTQFAKLNAEERLLKRKERFNSGGVGSVTKVPTTKEDWKEKAIQRLEHFSKPAADSTTVETSNKEKLESQS